MRENFNPIRNASDVVWAKFAADKPTFITTAGKPKLTKVQADGLRYEKRVQEYIGSSLSRGDFSVSFNPWIMYRLAGDYSSIIRFCQPDCIFYKPFTNHVTIVEIKLSHTADSWRQLRQLYEPVVRYIFGEETGIALLEVCKWYDPNTQFPETFYYAETILETKRDKIGVHIYRPRGRAKRAGA